jgi:phosphoserine phosphatase
MSAQRTGHGTVPQPASAELSAIAALEKLLAISRRLGESSDLSQVLSIIIDALRDLLTADRASVFTYDAATHELVIHVAHGIGGGGQVIRIPANRGIAGAAAESREIVNIPDAYADARFDRSVDQRTGYRTTSVLAVPLMDHEGALVGVAQVLNKASGPFDGRDEWLARGIAAQAAVALRRAALIEDHLARAKLEEEMNVARTIQQGSFPTALPQVDGYEIAARSTPAEDCGGDAYDCIGIDDSGVVAQGAAAARVMFLLADATGHGVGPALSSMQARGMARVGARLRTGLLDTAREVNNQLCQDLPSGRFVTAWLGLLDGRTHSVESFSAGQGPLFVYRYAEDRFEPIDTDAPPFGVIDFGFPCEQSQRITLSPRDLLLVLTDGYYEAMSPDGTQWGDPAVLDVVRTLRDRPCSEILDALDAGALSFSQAPSTADDRTAVIVRRLA